MNTKLRTALKHLARQAGGSHKTVHDRIVIIERLYTELRQHNIQIKHIDHLKTRHIQHYIQNRLAQGVEKRTLQNEMSAIRGVLKQAGRHKLAQSPQLSNQALNIHDTRRDGTHTAITPEHYQQVMQTAQAKDQGLAAAIQLARVMGLRGEEAIQSVQSLNTWHTALKQGKEKLTVVFGTKGGRPRDTRIINREQVQHAVDNALHIAKQQNHRLIDKPNLKQAMTYWRNQTRRIGLTGKHSPHSLRYAWAQEAIHYYKQQGYTDKEALALTSMDLGHGDGRGRYVKQVYGGMRR
ncbi:MULTISPECIES: integrase domain-containing protein [unclassified Serratia (in: enterobacteria)]|uniref:integrase domain-containing protein n=1 Tax=unclassified Serratia (in: enterobacteria) TaxID=2647522 RepID=UPI0005054F48|nr:MULTISPECIES: integrase domain-containing protein [unclassified Serratia (in: enterobacteria)]KFK96454.1 DNA-binding protein [Serratia sp. Ag2]KFK99929.1 DNA-binding protein [Serratia sp. Ag1]